MRFRSIRCYARVQSQNNCGTAGIRNWKEGRNFRLRIRSKTRPRESEAEAAFVSTHERAVAPGLVRMIRFRE